MKTLALILALSVQEKAPDAPAIAEAEKTVRELFKDEYAKKAPKDRASLGQKLLEQARQSKDSPAMQHVLYREAQDNLAQGGDLSRSIEAIDEWSLHLAIDAVDYKAKAIAIAAKLAKTPEEGLALGAAYLKVADAAALVDRFDVAEKQIQAAMAMSRKASNVAALNRATLRSKEILEQKGAYEKLKKSRDALAANPEDPDANLALGRYHCFVKGYWDAGLPLLAKGSDAALKDLASKDLAMPKEPEAQAEVGDGWWEISGKSTGSAKTFLKARAAGWYDKALPRLQGLAKTKVEQRASEYYLTLLFQGTWTNVEPKLFVGGKPGQPEPPPTGMYGKSLEPPGGTEYEGVSMRIRAAGNDGGLILLQLENAVPVIAFYFNLESKQVYATVKDGVATRMQKGATCDGKDEYVMTVVLTEGAAVVYVDGREKYRLQTEMRLVKYVQFQRMNGSCIVDQVKLRKKG